MRTVMSARELRVDDFDLCGGVCASGGRTTVGRVAWATMRLGALNVSQ
jgi:hypothetical protein